MTDFGKLNFSTSFNPTSAFPLDARVLFSSLEEAQAAATSAEAPGSKNTQYFFGQKLLVLTETTAQWYKITPQNTLEKEGGSGDGSDLPSVTEEDDGKVLTVSGGQWVAKELPKYDGEYSVTPSAEGDITLETAQTMLDADVIVNKIPYAEVSNSANGTTVTIA